MIRVSTDLYHLDAIDLEAVAVVLIQDEPETLISARKLQALASLCRNVAKRSNRARQSLLMEFVDEAERVGLMRVG